MAQSPKSLVPMDRPLRKEVGRGFVGNQIEGGAWANVARRPSEFTHPAVRHIRAHNPTDTQPRFVRSSATERQMMQNDAIIGTAR